MRGPNGPKVLVRSALSRDRSRAYCCFTNSSGGRRGSGTAGSKFVGLGRQPGSAAVRVGEQSPAWECRLGRQPDLKQLKNLGRQPGLEGYTEASVRPGLRLEGGASPAPPSYAFSISSVSSAVTVASSFFISDAASAPPSRSPRSARSSIARQSSASLVAPR
jgi:hypothetical protein